MSSHGREVKKLVLPSPEQPPLSNECKCNKKLVLSHLESSMRDEHDMVLLSAGTWNLVARPSFRDLPAHEHPMSRTWGHRGQRMGSLPSLGRPQKLWSLEKGKDSNPRNLWPPFGKWKTLFDLSMEIPLLAYDPLPVDEVLDEHCLSKEAARKLHAAAC